MSAVLELPVVSAPDVPDLIPARMLNEFTYCPRLGYLEFVQGEFADNLETLEGTFGHRRVDQPSRGEVPAPHFDAQAADGERAEGSPGDELPKAGEVAEGAPEVSRGRGRGKKGANGKKAGDGKGVEAEPIHARSVMLSAPGEGLIARMDLLEVEGNVVTPVDYKRGSVPDLPEGAWEPERVQLCAQGLILREAGYQCDGGVLYYIESRRRVTIPFDDALVARTRQLVVQFRETAEDSLLQSSGNGRPQPRREPQVANAAGQVLGYQASPDKIESRPA